MTILNNIQIFKNIYFLKDEKIKKNLFNVLILHLYVVPYTSSFISLSQIDSTLTINIGIIPYFLTPQPQQLLSWRGRCLHGPGHSTTGVSLGLTVLIGSTTGSGSGMAQVKNVYERFQYMYSLLLFSTHRVGVTHCRVQIWKVC